MKYNNAMNLTPIEGREAAAFGGRPNPFLSVGVCL